MSTSPATTTLINAYRCAARAGEWQLCLDIVQTFFVLRRLDEALRTEVIYASGFAREHQGDVRNARRAYDLAASRGHAKAARRLTALGGPLPPVEPQRNY